MILELELHVFLLADLCSSYNVLLLPHINIITNTNLPKTF